MQRSCIQAFELVLMASRQPLGRLELDGEPNPGGVISFRGEDYIILERRHRYQYIQGQYELVHALLYVQPSQGAEAELMNGQWVLGDRSCRFNGRSPLIRCAVNPQGPCGGCADYESLNGAAAH